MLTLAEVVVERGGTRVLDGVSATLAQGVCTAVVGPSGSGKSTLLRLLDRLLEPTSGTVTLHGRPLPSYDVLELRRRVGLVQQVPVVLEATVLEDLRVGRAVTDDEARALLERVALPVGLDRDTRDLSGGEAQRLCLARALAVEPEVVLLDEPTSALDPAAARAVEDVVAGLVADGLTVVLVSHDAQQARRLAQDVVVLEAGRVVETGAAATASYLS